MLCLNTKGSTNPNKSTADAIPSMSVLICSFEAVQTQNEPFLSLLVLFPHSTAINFNSNLCKSLHKYRSVPLNSWQNHFQIPISAGGCKSWQNSVIYELNRNVVLYLTLNFCIFTNSLCNVEICTLVHTS